MHSIKTMLSSLTVLTLAGLSAGNVCDGINAKPNLYTPYYSADCPPVNTPYSDGSCAGWKSTDVGCTSFCQNDTTFHYGQESPFARSDCHYPVSCSISESSSTSYSYGTSISPKIGKALKIGVSGSFSYGTSVAHARSWSFEPKEGDCGYFTWVPIVKTVCGPLTDGTVITLDPTDPNPIEICQPNPPTIASSCYDEAWTLGDQPDGVVVFVYTDCRTRIPLPADKQDPTYNQPGVSLSPATVSAEMAAWANDTCSINSRAAPAGSGDGIELFDFVIQGASLLWEQIGDSGVGLQVNLASCGNGTMLSGPEDTPWDFTWTPEDPDFDFIAKGTLMGPEGGLLSTPNCVGNWVTALGGPDKGSCQGW